jgi:Domain of unknown function (DUF4438)
MYRIGHERSLRMVPGTGGICYSHLIGDSALHLAGDHVEPGVSIRAKDRQENAALNTLCCVGNEARVITGDAKGARGVVCGTHGGVDHVMIDFARNVLDELAIGDKIQVRALGAGSYFEEIPGVKIFKAAPLLLEKWGISIRKGKLRVPVTHRVPAVLMGSGLGVTSAHAGDYDIQMTSAVLNKKYSLETLRFGDIVAIEDMDHSYGPSYREGSLAIGVIVHSGSGMSGHGPGVTSLLSGTGDTLELVISKEANIGNLLSIGRWRKPTTRKRRTN